MIDFRLNIGAETQLWHILLFLFFYLICFFSNRKYIDNSYKSNQSWSNFILFFSVVFLSIVALNRGDFYHYADAVQNQKSFHESSMEVFFDNLATFVGGNYLLWRLVVWGGALLLMLLTIKRLGIEKNFAFFVFFILYINIFNYSRASLAMSVYFLGLSLIIKNDNVKLLSFVIGCFLIWSCQFFHKSASVLVFCTIFAFVPLNKRTIPVLLILTLLLMNYGYDYFVKTMQDREAMDETAYRFIYYSDSSSRFADGLASVINQFLKYGTFYIPFIILTRAIYFSGNKFDRIIKRLYGVTFAIVLVATVFAFTAATNVYFYRVLYMSFAPICYLIVSVYSTGGLSNKQLKTCVFLGLTSIVFDSLYNIYLKLV